MNVVVEDAGPHARVAVHYFPGLFGVKVEDPDTVDFGVVIDRGDDREKPVGVQLADAAPVLFDYGVSVSGVAAWAPTVVRRCSLRPPPTSSSGTWLACERHERDALTF